MAGRGADEPVDALRPGARITLAPTAMAHGGEAIAHAPDGRVVFISGAIPGDVVEVDLTAVKRRWGRGHVVRILDSSEFRVDPVCEAAAAGGGCCDYTHIAPSAQPRFKREILTGQLDKFARDSEVLDSVDLAIDLEEEPLEPALGWRTRMRLGVDVNGHAGVRRSRSNDIVVGHQCAQAAPGLLDGIVGSHAGEFTPGAELIVVLDSLGQRHVVETTRAQRGRRTERIDSVIEGGGSVTEIVTVDGQDYRFTFPPTAFWQAHTAAPNAYAGYVADWALDTYTSNVGWDLYGGVGVFVPSISAALGDGAQIHSVDYSTAATRDLQTALGAFDVQVRNQKVEAAVADLPAPALVVLDPPRTGAGQAVVTAIADSAPQRVIHIECDPATFARDLSAWGDSGYSVERIALVDAFPGTHHFEVVASLVSTQK